MKVNKEKLEKSQIKLTIELEPEALIKYRSEAAKELQDKVNVPGFRKGHMPIEVLEKHIGEQSFLAHTIEIALSDSYEEAIAQEKIQPLEYPKINVVSHNPLKYEATVSVMPEIEIKKGYEKVKVKQKKVEIKKEEIDQVLENLKKQSLKWHDVERASKKGDRLEVDFEGKDETGVPLDGTKSKNHPIIIGDNNFIPGFEDELIGLKKDEEKDFDIVFPKDYHNKAFQSKKVKFHIKVGRIEEAEDLKVDDKFVEEFTKGKHKTLKELEDEIKKEITHQKEAEMDVEMENEAIEKLAEFVKAEVPDILIEREIDYILNGFKSDLKRRGVTWEDYLKTKNKEEKELRKEYTKQAEKQVVIRLGIEKLYELENVSVDDKGIEGELTELLKNYPPEYADKIKDSHKEGTKGREMLTNRLMLKKLLQKFTEK